MDRALGTKEVPLLNRDEPYISDANRTQEDDISQTYYTLKSLNKRTRMSKNRFEEIYIHAMRYFAIQEKFTYKRYQSGELSENDFIKECSNFLKHNFEEMRLTEKDILNGNEETWDFKAMMNRLYISVFGYDVLQPLIDHPEMSDIKICAPDDIRVRVGGKAYQSDAYFIDEDDLVRFVEGIAIRNHINMDAQPMLTFTDAHDKNYILRFCISNPSVCSVDYPYLHIRKIPKNKLNFDQLIERKLLNKKVKEYLIDRAKLAKGIVFAGPPGCVDCETEFFNGKEWKFISKYQEGELVLQYDTTTQVASLVTPTRYIKEPCEKMNHFETSKGIDQTLSDEHRVLYLEKTHKDGEKIWGSRFHEMSAEELFEKQNNGKFWGGFQTSFHYDGKGISLTDAEIKVMLAVICDGTFDKRNESNLRCSLNLKKERKIIEVKRILDEANIPYKETMKKNGYKLIVFQAPRREKAFTSHWYDCSKHQLQLICDNILQWDGHIDSVGRKQFSSSIKTSIDFVQFAFSSCGYRATISELDRTGTFKTINEKSYERKTKEYSVIISTNNIVAMGHHKNKNGSSPIIKKVDTKDGYKYCFTVPTHALVLRRNGKIFITGNSGKTTALNAFIDYIPRTKETLVIQENDELNTTQSGFMFKHVSHGFQGEPIATLEDLAKMALVEGCNYFVIGEVKGGEMRYAMTLLNAGGQCALTVHATNAYEILDKLADLVKYGSDYSFEEARRMLKTFDTLVYMENYKIRDILECRGYDDQSHQFIYDYIYHYNPEEGESL